ncbi:hypothetical protein [Bradyrhizobium vignae]|uniref:hypothetical protein n=1 Tax=Bradyrhizobium vignae TaxID=1549949 RepID=UPI0011AE7207|nr:hypothetical protein [Bradyrhizobium vignae]
MKADVALATDRISMPVCFSFRQVASPYPLASGFVWAERRALAKMVQCTATLPMEKVVSLAVLGFACSLRHDYSNPFRSAAWAPRAIAD